jgi:hypothetical protein
MTGCLRGTFLFLLLLLIAGGSVVAVEFEAQKSETLCNGNTASEVLARGSFHWLALICGAGHDLIYNFNGIHSDVLYLITGNSDSSGNTIYTQAYNGGLGILNSTGNGYLLKLGAFPAINLSTILNNAYYLNLKALFDVNPSCQIDGGGKKFTLTSSSINAYNGVPSL